jgi:hypothetical protein
MAGQMAISILQGKRVLAIRNSRMTSDTIMLPPGMQAIESL